MTDKEPEVPSAAAPAAEELTPQQFIDESDRFMALKQWEKAADGYAQALELLQETYGDDAPTLAPVLQRYGKCLLEYAIVTSGALGGGGSKEAPMPQAPKKKTSGSAAAGSSSSSSSAAKPSDPRFHFSGDADDDDDEEGEDAEGGDGAAQGDEDEEEDDLGVAFSILDLTRVIYQRVLRGGKSDPAAQEDANATLETLSGETWGVVKIKSELAEVLNYLGDVGLESENFTQAASDYEGSLSLLSALLHPHSRRLADAYLRLGLALEFHPDAAKQSATSQHVQSAANTLRLRLEAVQTRRKTVQEQGDEEARKQSAAAQVREEKALEESAAADAKGKGKSSTASAAAVVVETPTHVDDVALMDALKLEREEKDLQEILAELDAKLQDISSSGSGAANADASGSTSSSAVPTDAKAALQQAINDAFLGSSTNSADGSSGSAGTTPFGASSSSSAPVNDLSSMVRKKKKREVDEGEDAKGKGKDAQGASSSSAAAATNGEAVAAADDERDAKKAKI